ncbi:hypothetical protein Q9966_001705 [Columba livia]|nr:hypothetical protein Q9966_001705 [Columba livia]
MLEAGGRVSVWAVNCITARFPALRMPAGTEAWKCSQPTKQCNVDIAHSVSKGYDSQVNSTAKQQRRASNAASKWTHIKAGTAGIFTVWKWGWFSALN